MLAARRDTSSLAINTLISIKSALAGQPKVRPIRNPMTGGRAMEGTAAISKSQKNERSWRGFQLGPWSTSIDVRDFIVRNATPYSGDEKFLVGPSKRTQAVWDKLQPYFRDEQKKGVL